MRLKDYFLPYLDYLKAKGNAPKTIHNDEIFLHGALKHSVAGKKIKDLKIVDAAFVAEAGRNHGKYGMQRSVVVFRKLLNYLEESGYQLPFNWTRIKIPKVPEPRCFAEYLNQEEIEILRNLFNGLDITNLRTRAIMELMLVSGLRIGEACSLNKEDIKWEQKEARVMNIKTKEWEIVYFTDYALSWLKRYLDSRKDDLPCLFVSGRAKLLTTTAKTYLRQATKHLNFGKHIRHHIFRKTYLTYLSQNGVDLQTIRALARHKSERTTLKLYIGMSIERAREIHQKVMNKLSCG